MSRQSTDDQLRFLLSCVRHSQNGKVDFIEVAKECGIVTKGAAAKRFERMMKANDINPNGGPAAAPPPTTPATPAKKLKKDSKATSKGSAAKKRKIDDDTRASSADDDDGATLKPEGLQDDSPTLQDTSKSRRASRATAKFDKLSIEPNDEEGTKNAAPGSDNGQIFGGLYDGAEGTTAVVYADPNWGSAFPSHDNPHAAASSKENPFDTFTYADHPLHAPSSEFEAALFMNKDSNTVVEESQHGNGQLKVKAESIFIED